MQLVSQTLEHPEWKLLVEVLKDSDYGFEITHGRVQDLMGFRTKSRRYYDQVGHARKVLLSDFRRELECINGKGYRIVLPHEHLGRSRREVKMANRSIRRAVAVLQAAPQELLNPEQLQRNAMALAKIGALATLGRSTMLGTRPSLKLPPRPDVPKLIG